MSSALSSTAIRALREEKENFWSRNAEYSEEEKWNMWLEALSSAVADRSSDTTQSSYRRQDVRLIRTCLSFSKSCDKLMVSEFIGLPVVWITSRLGVFTTTSRMGLFTTTSRTGLFSTARAYGDAGPYTRCAGTGILALFLLWLSSRAQFASQPR